MAVWATTRSRDHNTHCDFDKSVNENSELRHANAYSTIAWLAIKNPQLCDNDETIQLNIMLVPERASIICPKELWVSG